MTTLFVLLLLLTSGLHFCVGVPAVQRVWARKRGEAGGAQTFRLKDAALGLAVLVFLAAHVAHDAQSPYTVMAGAQDEIEWLASSAVASVDTPAAREGE